MLISKDLELAFNEQTGHEFGASLQYFNIAAYFDADDLPQLAAFFYRQGEEEKMHALKFVQFIVDAGGQVRIPAVAQPRYDFPSAEDAAKLSLDWELEVTNQINALMDLAIEQNNYIAQEFLRWFEAEQLEEVSSMGRLLSVIRRAGDNLLLVEDFLARNSIGNQPQQPAA